MVGDCGLSQVWPQPTVISAQWPQPTLVISAHLFPSRLSVQTVDFSVDFSDLLHSSENKLGNHDPLLYVLAFSVSTYTGFIYGIKTWRWRILYLMANI